MSASSKGRPSQGTPGPGWYPDPRRIYEERYWDGGRWTDRVQGQHREDGRARGEETAGLSDTTIAGPAQKDREPVPDADMARKIEQLAKVKLDMRLGVSRELKKLPSLLLEGEDVLNLARGRYDGKQGLVVLSDRRVLFMDEGVIRSRLEDFPYAKISSVQSETAMMYGKLQIFASGNKAEIDQILPKVRASEIGSYVRHRIAEPHAGATRSAPPSPVGVHHASVPAAAVAPAVSGSDIVDQIKKLGELRDAGILTAEEFEAKKTELLARL